MQVNDGYVIAIAGPLKAGLLPVKCKIKVFFGILKDKDLSVY
jgi:hypothetical protein